MRILALAVLASVAASLAPRPAAAAFNLPWCAQYYDRSGIRSCAFYTYQQCMATLSGIGGFCIQNPWVPPGRSPMRHAAPSTAIPDSLTPVFEQAGGSWRDFILPQQALR